MGWEATFQMGAEWHINAQGKNANITNDVK
jgi:hypothetical protein